MSALRSIQSRWWIVAGLVALGAIAGYLPAPERVEEQATSFSATHTMLTNEGGDASIVSPSQVVLLATVGEVPERAAQALNYNGNAAELASEVDVQFDFDTGALTFTTEQQTAERAEAIADTFAEELNSYLAERQSTVYQDQLTASRNQLTQLQDELDQLTAELATDPTDPRLLAERDAVSRQYSLAFEKNGALEQDPGQLVFTTLQSAQAVPQVARGLSAPTSRTTRAAMGMVVGGVLGIALAVLLARVDRKIRTREQAEEIVGMRARVVIPKVRDTAGGVVVSAGRHDPLSDAYRTVRNVLSFVQSGQPIEGRARITLVVSPGPGDGKTSLAANIAAAFAELGQRTIAVNTDFRRPRLHSALLGDPAPQLPFDLDELADVPRRALPLDTPWENMKVLDLATVSGSPGQLVRATARQVQRLADGADQIVIDTSPVGATAEVLDLVPLADVIVLVARVGHTSISAGERAVSILQDIADAPMVFVLGGVKSERNPYDEYSGSRPGTAGSAEDDTRPIPQAAG